MSCLPTNTLRFERMGLLVSRIRGPCKNPKKNLHHWQRSGWTWESSPWCRAAEEARGKQLEISSKKIKILNDKFSKTTTHVYPVNFDDGTRIVYDFDFPSGIRPRIDEGNQDGEKEGQCDNNSDHY